MTISDSLVLRKLFKKHLRQGDHYPNLVEIFKIIRLVFKRSKG